MREPSVSLTVECALRAIEPVRADVASGSGVSRVISRVGHGGQRDADVAGDKKHRHCKGNISMFYFQ